MSKLVSEVVELLWVSRLGNSIQQKLRHVVIRRFRSKQIVLFDFSWRNWFNFCVSGHFFLTSFSINHFDGNIWVEVFPFLTKKSSELKKNLRQLFFNENLELQFISILGKMSFEFMKKRVCSELWFELNLTEEVSFEKGTVRTKALRSLKWDLPAVNFRWTYLVNLIC